MTGLCENAVLVLWGKINLFHYGNTETGQQKYAGQSTTAGDPVNTLLQLKCWKYKEMDKGGLKDGKWEKKTEIYVKNSKKVHSSGNKCGKEQNNILIKPLYQHPVSTVKWNLPPLRKATCSWQRLYRKAPDSLFQQCNPEVYWWAAMGSLWQKLEWGFFVYTVTLCIYEMTIMSQSLVSPSGSLFPLRQPKLLFNIAVHFFFLLEWFRLCLLLFFFGLFSLHWSRGEAQGRKANLSLLIHVSSARP